jgi:putative transposase
MKWSSLPSYIKGNGPDWWVMERVLPSFELAQDGRGRRAYVAGVEARTNTAGGQIDEAAMQAIRRGWYLGKETFKDRLLKHLKKSGQTTGGAQNRTEEALREHSEVEAERMVRRIVPRENERG